MGAGSRTELPLLGKLKPYLSHVLKSGDMAGTIKHETGHLN